MKNIIEMNNNKCTIHFTGRAGILFTDENGIQYDIDTEMLASKKYDIALSKRSIKPVAENLKLSDNDKDIIVSKILEFTPGIKWLVE